MELGQKQTFPAEVEHLPEMLEFICSYARKKGFTGKSLFQIELASEEALVNIARYAYPSGLGEVAIALEGGEALQIEITDRGIPFDPLEEAQKFDPTPPKVGGYGIFLFVQLMDHVHYERKGDKNILTLRKEAPIHSG